MCHPRPANEHLWLPMVWTNKQNGPSESVPYTAASLVNYSPSKSNTDQNIQIVCFGSLAFEPRDVPHWIRPCYFVVFMCPELRYGPVSGKNDFGTPLPNKRVKVCLISAGSLVIRELVIRSTIWCIYFFFWGGGTCHSIIDFVIFPCDNRSREQHA